MPLILISMVEWHCPYGEMEVNKSDVASQELQHVCTNIPAAFKTSDFFGSSFVVSWTFSLFSSLFTISTSTTLLILEGILSMPRLVWKYYV